MNNNSSGKIRNTGYIGVIKYNAYNGITISSDNLGVELNLNYRYYGK